MCVKEFVRVGEGLCRQCRLVPCAERAEKLTLKINRLYLGIVSLAEQLMGPYPPAYQREQHGPAAPEKGVRARLDAAFSDAEKTIAAAWGILNFLSPMPERKPTDCGTLVKSETPDGR